MSDKKVFLNSNGQYLKFWAVHSGFTTNIRYAFEWVDDINLATLGTKSNISNNVTWVNNNPRKDVVAIIAATEVVTRVVTLVVE